MMAALAKALSQATGADIDVEGLKGILIVCGAGLLLSLAIAMAYGVDLEASASRAGLLEVHRRSAVGLPRSGPETRLTRLFSDETRLPWRRRDGDPMASHRPASQSDAGSIPTGY